MEQSDLDYLKGNFAAISRGLGDALSAIGDGHFTITHTFIKTAKDLADASVLFMERKSAGG